MSDLDLSARELDAITSVIAEFPSIDQAVLFGSRAMGRATAGSDVDIALKGKQLSRQVVTVVSARLNEESYMPYHFDVLDYDSISNEALRAHIDRVGILVYQVGPRSED